MTRHPLDYTMEDDIDVIEYPFEIEEQSPPVFIKTKNGYDVKICGRLDSKKITASVSRKPQRYLHVEVSGDKCRVVGRTGCLYVFCTPADFYVPSSSGSRGFYEDVYMKLVHGDMNQCLELAETFDRVFKNNELPMYPVPITSTVESFENYNLKDFRGGRDEGGDTIHVGYDDEVPGSPSPELVDRLRGIYTQEALDVQDSLFSCMFSTHPVLRISNIMKMFRNDDRAVEAGFSHWKVKKLLPVYAYFVTSGPWRGCWVRFGYDPKRDPGSFKYQIYDSRRSGRMFQVFEAEDIVQEVERNRSWYLCNTPSFKTGFHTKALLNLLRYRTELDFDANGNEEESNLEFEVFD